MITGTRLCIKTHGLTKTRVYRIWKAMRNRCSNPRHPSYSKYGGVGIKVCEAWNDFQVFYRDMGLPPSMDHSIDREDGTKGYEPGNCVWATDSEQSRNRKSNRLYTRAGVTKCLKDWATELGISYSTLRDRLDAGWPEDRAFGTGARTYVRGQ